MPINYRLYPPNWKTEIRPRILQRANHKCEFCTTKNYSVYFNKIGKLCKVILTIAHLDHDEDNWCVTDDRLRALCQACHLLYDCEEKFRRRKLKDNYKKTGVKC